MSPTMKIPMSEPIVEIHDLLDSLGAILYSAGLVDEDHHPVSGVEISTADSAGALYNYLFVEEDRSIGVHNTAYAVALLKSSINYLNTGDPNGAPQSSDEQQPLTGPTTYQMRTNH